MSRKVALAIGGLDPSTGAGITADCISFAVIGVHGVSVATALTYQSTRGVSGFGAVAERDMVAQLDALLEDVDVGAVKLGMLASDVLVHALDPYLTRWLDAGVPVVFDPVTVAGNGQPLYEGVPEKIFGDVVLPRVTLVTPNTLELASLIGDQPAANQGELRTQVRVFQSRYGPAVLATGGHIGDDGGDGDVADILFTGSEMREYRRTRVAGNIHGTGCLIAAAIAGYMAQGLDLMAAFQQAEEYATAAVAAAYAPGTGVRVPNRTAAVFDDAERWRVYNNVARAVNIFSAAANTYKLIPEVGTNIVYALPTAHDESEICAVPGRIIRINHGVESYGHPAFGASGHMARAVKTVMKYDPSYRAAMNVRYGEDVIAACSELGYRMASFDRGDEPEEDASAEGTTLQWGVGRAAAGGNEAVPDVVYDCGAVGKEPMVRLFGRDAIEVVRRAVAISRRL
ncbi:MAG: thiamine-phosphate synthase family protein [Candidatus Zixiibacteriota bacterium]|jgi:hydroxymethylpyrimidine/phosphomethylpyrimidine kinase